MKEVLLLLLAYQGFLLALLIVFGRGIKTAAKGERLLRIRQRGIEDMPEPILYAGLSVTLVGAAYGLLEVLKGNYGFMPLAFGMPLTTAVVLLAPIDYEIYTHGIQRGARFFSWKEIEEMEWKNGILTVRTKSGILSRTLRLIDTTGNVWRTAKRLKLGEGYKEVHR